MNYNWKHHVRISHFNNTRHIERGYLKYYRCFINFIYFRNSKLKKKKSCYRRNVNRRCSLFFTIRRRRRGVRIGWCALSTRREKTFRPALVRPRPTASSQHPRLPSRRPLAVQKRRRPGAGARCFRSRRPSPGRRVAVRATRTRGPSLISVPGNRLKTYDTMKTTRSRQNVFEDDRKVSRKGCSDDKK